METDKGNDRSGAQTPHNEVNVQGDGNVVVVTGDSSSVKIGDIRFDSVESYDSADFSNGHNSAGGSEAESAAAKACEKLLRTHYLNYSSKIQPTPWFEAGFQLKTADIYTELELTARSPRGIERPSSESDFRKRLVYGGCKRILVEGEPGVGKSTFCRKFALDWAADESSWTAEHFDLLIALNLRRMLDSGKLVDAIFDQLLPEDSGVDKTHLGNYIKKNQERVLIFLDGVDELETAWKSDVLKLVKRRVLPQTTVVATSRSTERRHLVAEADDHYIIKGFTPESVAIFVQKYFDRDEDAAEKLQVKIEEDDKIQILTTNPLNAVLLCVLWEDNEHALWSEVTELYRQIIVSIIKRFYKKSNLPVPQSKEIPEDFAVKLSNLGKMAFEGLKDKKGTFKQEDLDRHIISDDIIKAGFLYQEYGASRVESCTYWVFLHKTFQEFLAAYYLHCSGEANDEGVLTTIATTEELHNVCLFTAGLLSSQCSSLFTVLTEVLSNSNANTEYFSRLIQLVLVCLHESGNLVESARQVAPAILSEPDSLRIFSAKCTSQFFSGLTAVIGEYVRKNRDDEETTKLKSLVFNYPYSYTDMDVQLFDTLGRTSHLERLVMSVPHSTESMTALVIRNNPALRDVGLQIEGECHSIFLPHISEALASSASLTYLRLSINVEESRRPHATISPINKCLQHFSLYGHRQAENLFVGIAKDLSHHGCLKSLSTNFASSSLFAERREALASVIAKNKSLSKLSFNTERLSYSRHGTPESSPSPTRRSSRYKDLSSHPLFSGARRVKQEQCCKQAAGVFTEALEESSSLRHVVIKHFGDDADLLLLFDSIKRNRSIRQLVVVTENLKLHVLQEMFGRLEENPTVDIFATVSENAISASEADGRFSPSRTFGERELTSKVPANEGPIPGFPGFYIWEQWEAWFKEVTAFESKAGSCPDEVDSYAKERLLCYILPPLEDGFQVSVWERAEV